MVPVTEKNKPVVKKEELESSNCADRFCLQNESNKYEKKERETERKKQGWKNGKMEER